MQSGSRVNWLVLLVVCCLLGCSGSSDGPAGLNGDPQREVVTVYVVNYPLLYFAERIGGAQVDAIFPAPPDKDPAYWTPDAETIVEYQQADLILLNGASYAKWMTTVSLPETRVVDTSASCVDQYIEIEEGLTHSHGPGGEHAHGGKAFTTWLDPKLAIEQARAIADALAKQAPEHEQQFDTGFASLEQDLLELDAALEQAADIAKDRPLVFSHPVYQYLERRYGLNGKSVHWEPDEAPTDEQWNVLTELLKSHPAKLMIWEGEPDPAMVTRLRDLGMESTIFDPCGNTPESGDYLTVMQQNVSRLAEALGSVDGPADIDR